MKSSTHSFLLKNGSVPSRARGFSLIELMIAVTIGLLIVAALAGVLSTSSGASKTNQRSTEVQSNGRYALDVLRSDLRSAGFRGYTWAEPNAPTTTLGTISGGCFDSGGSASGFVTNLRQGIWGANDANPFSANCIPAASFATDGGDVLVIRKLGGTPATAITTNAFYFRTNYSSGEVFRGGQTTACPATSPVTPSPFDKVPCINGVHGRDLNDFPVQIYVYYISPFTTSATESPLVPALYRASLQSDGSFARELVASGIEHMQVQYGRATTDLNTRYYNAGDITGTSYATLPTEWDDVNTVRLWLLARNSTIEPGYANSNTYVMGDQSYTVSDSYRRQLFSAVVQLRN
jgi:type IV pilus assembly protein PilW